jgi:hypothetical protein
MKHCVLGASYFWPRSRVSLAELLLFRFYLDDILKVCSLSPFQHLLVLRSASLGKDAVLDQ